MSILDLKCGTDVAAMLAGMKVSTLQTWLRRNDQMSKPPANAVDSRSENQIIAERPIEGGGSQGNHRIWTLCNVMEIAVAYKAFDDCGVDLERALSLGAAFAYTGTLPGSMGLDLVGDVEYAKLMRQPGFPFYDRTQPALKTLAVVSPKGVTVLGWGEGYEPLREARVRLGGLTAWAAIECQEIFFTVCEKLGAVPFDVLDEVYQISSV